MNNVTNFIIQVYDFHQNTFLKCVCIIADNSKPSIHNATNFIIQACNFLLKYVHQIFCKASKTMFLVYFDLCLLSYFGTRFIHETSLGDISLWLVIYQAKGVSTMKQNGGMFRVSEFGI